MSNTQDNVATPDVAAARRVVEDRIHNGVVLSKLAECGRVAKTPEEAQALLKIAQRVATIDIRPSAQPEQQGTYAKLASQLDSTLAANNLISQDQLDAEHKDVLKAAAYGAAANDPELFEAASVLLNAQKAAAGE